MKNQIEMLIKAGGNISDTPINAKIFSHALVFMMIVSVPYISTGNLGHAGQVLLF